MALRKDTGPARVRHGGRYFALRFQEPDWVMYVPKQRLPVSKEACHGDMSGLALAAQQRA